MSISKRILALAEELGLEPEGHGDKDRTRKHEKAAVTLILIWDRLRQHLFELRRRGLHRIRGSLLTPGPQLPALPYRSSILTTSSISGVDTSNMSASSKAVMR